MAKMHVAKLSSEDFEMSSMDVSLPSSVAMTPSRPATDSDFIEGMLPSEHSDAVETMSAATPPDLPSEDGGPQSDSDQTLFMDDYCVDGPKLPMIEIQVPLPLDIEKWMRHRRVPQGNSLGMELYSPPRVLPMTDASGICSDLGCLSFDILNGWDFRVTSLKALSIRILESWDIARLFLSPPCTMFSELQRLFNYKRMTKEVFDARMQEARGYLQHSMHAAKKQHLKRRMWMYEHPWKASSWKLEEIQSVQKLPGVYTVDFDMCACGLLSPAGVPVKKRTRIMSNSKSLLSALKDKQCDRSHEHRPIEGSEMGHSMSKWCQVYPPGLVSILADQRHCCID